MTAGTKIGIRIAVIAILSIILTIVLFVAGYIIYVAMQYSRIEDNLKIQPERNVEEVAKSSATFSAMTYNFGFGAYDNEYSFFLDKGKDENGKKLAGKYGKAVSKENTQKNTQGSATLLKDNIADFVFVQELDTDSSRSYNINQFDYLNQNVFAEYSQNYAVNFHSAYLILPLNDPHGTSNSGVATYSKFKVNENIRRSYPVDKGVAKYFDLDRCFMLSRIPLDNGKSLTLINNHMSAYDKGGKIRKLQLEFLNTILKSEREAGNYVVVGGDFNHDLHNGAISFPTKQPYPDWVAKMSNEDFPQGFSIVASKNVGTCRSAEIPYTQGYNFEVVVDGFVVSDNIEVVSVQTIDNQYKYSDHNPSKMIFKLK